MNPAKRLLKLDECRAAMRAGDAAGADRIARALLRDNPADVQALQLLGVQAAARHDYDTAVRHFQRCVAIAPRDTGAHNDLARVHALCGRYEQAVASLERVLALQPGHPRASTDLADVLERSGDHRRGRELLQSFADAGTMSDDMALVFIRLLQRAGEPERAIATARERLAAPSVDPVTRRFLLQLLGRLLDQLGDRSAAFAAFADAKRAEGLRFDAAGYGRAIDALITAFSAEALARLPRATTRSELPVFIACMPRSGSTLVEQVIHAHPQAFGAGEIGLLHDAVVRLPAELGGALPYPHCVGALRQADVDRLAARYLQDLAALAPGALRVSNKHLLNYLHLGMVALLFPGARVIHIRRDRLDNGLACFMTSLSPALMPWAGDLRHIGYAWRQYERLMDHWRSVLDLRFLEVRYEDLVEDTEAQIRRIVDFCGLPWDERCLRYWETDRVVLTPSYDQVRQPVFRTAMGRWKLYEEFLGPLKESLA